MKKIKTLILLSLALIMCFSSFAAAAEETVAPISQNLEISTYRGVSVGGRLTATAPDGGELTYKITTDPVKGTIELEDDGHFVYTPKEGKKGKDYFGYKATDASGASSQEATVIIRIEKQKSKVTYNDMDGNASSFAAHTLAEKGIFTGEKLGSDYIFSPNAPVTRSQFLTMCMEASGAELLTDVKTTGFADDDDISLWMKPYVGTALQCGVISGYFYNELAVFGPEREISVSEAAVMLDRTFAFTDVVSTWYDVDDAVPAWAAQSAANLDACQVLPYGVSVNSSTLTRAQAAEMIVSAMNA